MHKVIQKGRTNSKNLIKTNQSEKNASHTLLDIQKLIILKVSKLKEIIF